MKVRKEKKQSDLGRNLEDQVKLRGKEVLIFFVVESRLPV